MGKEQRTSRERKEEKGECGYSFLSGRDCSEIILSAQVFCVCVRVYMLDVCVCVFSLLPPFPPRETIHPYCVIVAHKEKGEEKV